MKESTLGGIRVSKSKSSRMRAISQERKSQKKGNELEAAYEQIQGHT